MSQGDFRDFQQDYMRAFANGLISSKNIDRPIHRGGHGHPPISCEQKPSHRGSVSIRGNIEAVAFTARQSWRNGSFAVTFVIYWMKEERYPAEKTFRYIPFIGASRWSGSIWKSYKALQFHRLFDVSGWRNSCYGAPRGWAIV